MMIELSFFGFFFFVTSDMPHWYIYTHTKYCMRLGKIPTATWNKYELYCEFQITRISQITRIDIWNKNRNQNSLCYQSLPKRQYHLANQLLNSWFFSSFISKTSRLHLHFFLPPAFTIFHCTLFPGLPVSIISLKRNAWTISWRLQESLCKLQWQRPASERPRPVWKPLSP